MKTRVFGVLAWTLIQFVGSTTTIVCRNRQVLDELRRQHLSPLFACWHGRQFFAYHLLRNQHLVAVASLSSDGEIISWALRRMGYDVVRGSSSRRSAGVLVEMIRKVKNGQGLAITVDGPKGPYHEVKMGVIRVAQATGNPIVPMAFSAERMWIARKSWDNYMIPKPFSRIYVKYMEPIFVPKNTAKEDLEIYRRRVQTSLEQGCREADEYCGWPGLEDELKRGRR